MFSLTSAIWLVAEVLVAELHPAQLTHRAGQRWIVQSSEITAHWIQVGARHHALLEPGRSAIVVVDIMRIKDGVVEGHRDMIQPEATKEQSKSKLPTFWGQRPAVGMFKFVAPGVRREG